MLVGCHTYKIRRVHIEAHGMNFYEVLAIFRLPYNPVTYFDVASVNVVDNTFVVGFHYGIALFVIPAAVTDRNDIALFKHIKFASYSCPLRADSLIGGIL
jgi:hypothetical protein